MEFLRIVEAVRRQIRVVGVIFASSAVTKRGKTHVLESGLVLDSKVVPRIVSTTFHLKKHKTIAY